jgi:hypothetical protein
MLALTGTVGHFALLGAGTLRYFILRRGRLLTFGRFIFLGHVCLLL